MLEFNNKPTEVEISCNNFLLLACVVNDNEITKVNFQNNKYKSEEGWFGKPKCTKIKQKNIYALCCPLEVHITFMLSTDFW